MLNFARESSFTLVGMLKLLEGLMFEGLGLTTVGWYDLGLGGLRALQK